MPPDDGGMNAELCPPRERFRRSGESGSAGAHSGEPLPIVGIGTAVMFDFENNAPKLTIGQRLTPGVSIGKPVARHAR